LCAQDYACGFPYHWLEWLIIQNTNAYEVDFTAAWDGLRGAYGKARSPESEKRLKLFCKLTPSSRSTPTAI